MQMEFGGKPDLAHRLQGWVAENKFFLILVLAGGIGFFGLLAGLTVWHHQSQEKAAVVRFDLIEQAQAARSAKDWPGCVGYYEELYRQAKHDPFYRVLALHGIGTCQREGGDLEASALAFERAAKEPGHVGPSVSDEEAKKSREMKDEKKK